MRGNPLEAVKHLEPEAGAAAGSERIETALPVPARESMGGKKKRWELAVNPPESVERRRMGTVDSALRHAHPRADWATAVTSFVAMGGGGPGSPV